MFLIVVFVVLGAAVSECGVILQPNLGLRWSYPPSAPLSYITAAPVITNYRVYEQLPETSVSYAISYKDYLLLKEHKIHGKDSPYNPDPIRDSYVKNQEHVHNYHHSEHKESAPKPTIVSQSAVLKRSTGTNVAIDHNLPLFRNVNVPVEPIVSKHIYFHVPPPDFEEKSNIPVVLPPQKKHYNIIFIKAPTHEPNYAQWQQILQSISPSEEKTLIYVLSKTQEPQVPVVSPLPLRPVESPEVYYVKYKVNQKDGGKINSELSERSLLQTVSPVLEQRRGDERP